MVGSNVHEFKLQVIVCCCILAMILVSRATQKVDEVEIITCVGGERPCRSHGAHPLGKGGKRGEAAVDHEVLVAQRCEGGIGSLVCGAWMVRRGQNARGRL